MTDLQKEKALEVYNMYLNNLKECQAKFGIISYALLEKYYSGTYSYFSKLAMLKSNNINKDVSVWDFVSSIFPNAKTEANKSLTPEMIESALVSCQNEYGIISRKNLLQVDSRVFNYLSKSASAKKKKGENVDMWDVALEFVPNIKIDRKSNYYDLTIKSLHDCCGKYSVVSLKYLSQDWPLAYRYISHNVTKRKAYGDLNITMADICKELAPDLPFEDAEFFDSEKKILEALSQYADQNGCVDNFKENNALYNAVIRYAKKDGLHYSNWISNKSSESLGKKLVVNNYMQDVDNLIDNHKKQIEMVYGKGGDLNGISVDHPELYMLLRTIRTNMGGKHVTMQQVARSLGFTFDNGESIPDTKVNENALFDLLWKTYPSGMVENIEKNPEVKYMLSEMTKIKECSILDCVSACGMNYVKLKDGNRIKRRKKLLNKNRVKNDSITQLEDTL